MKGFTYIELLVVIVLISIIVGSGYFATNALNKQFSVVKDQKANLEKLSAIDLQLRKAMVDSEEVNFENDEIKFLYGNGSQSSLVNKGDALIFSKGVKDTLKTKVTNFEVFKDLKKVNVNITLNIKGVNIQLCYSKSNGG